nr:alkaline phosphatase family protein [Mycobacterium noviomagense]
MIGPGSRKSMGYRIAGLCGASAFVGALLLFVPAHVGKVAPPVDIAAATIPTPAHVVIVMEENHDPDDVIGNTSAPYINALATNGAYMRRAFAEAHPSEPNYMALFAGRTFDLIWDFCPVNEGNTPNLGAELLAAGLTFTGFAEDLPAVGSTVCTSGNYDRAHAPWVNFSNVPASDSVPFSAFPAPANYASLPTVSFVIPNLVHDMHSGTVAQADSWLQQNLSSYAEWAKANNSLLIVVWDESNDYFFPNRIPMIFYGANVKPGTYDEQINHYNLLSTLEQMYGLPKTGNAANATAITDIWGS